MTPLATTRQTRAVKGGHDAVPPPNRKPFSIPAQIGLQPEPAAGQSAAARMPDPNPKTSPLPRLLALGFALLFIAAVPWYWADGGEPAGAWHAALGGGEHGGFVSDFLPGGLGGVSHLAKRR